MSHPSGPDTILSAAWAMGSDSHSPPPSLEVPACSSRDLSASPHTIKRPLLSFLVFSLPLYFPFQLCGSISNSSAHENANVLVILCYEKQ